jgi:hypothetical protein
VRGVKFNTDSHAVPRLRMIGSVPPVSLHNFVACRDKVSFEDSDVRCDVASSSESFPACRWTNGLNSQGSS